MDKVEAVAALAALAQESRLDVFRLLVQAGPEGKTPGQLAEQLGLPGATLSFHLSQLRHAGLVANPALDCAAFPCTEIFSGASATSLDFALAPTAEQWANAKPPPDPEDLDGGVK